MESTDGNGGSDTTPIVIKDTSDRGTPAVEVITAEIGCQAGAPLRIEKLDDLQDNFKITLSEQETIKLKLQFSMFYQRILNGRKIDTVKIEDRIWEWFGLFFFDTVPGGSKFT